MNVIAEINKIIFESKIFKQKEIDFMGKQIKPIYSFQLAFENIPLQMKFSHTLLKFIRPIAMMVPN